MPPKAKKSWYAIHKAENSAVVEISIMDEIGFWGVDADEFRNAIKGIAKGSKIVLHINSPGGEVTTGNEMFNTLREFDGEVEVEIGALCASIATVIAMAGATVSIPENGIFMIHNPFVGTVGDANELKTMAKVLDDMKAQIIQAYKLRSTLTEEEISDLMDAETWLTAEEALAAGFVDSIRKPDEDDEGVENFDLTTFRNSAAFLAKLQGKPEAKGQPVKLKDLQKASLRFSNQKPPTNKPMPPELTKEQETAIQEAAAKAAAPLAKEMLNKRLTRDREINAIVVNMRTRDKRDFGDFATAWLNDPLNDERTETDFAAALMKSDKFTEWKEPVGSGIEVLGVQGLEKGTPGEVFVASAEYRALRDIAMKGGRINQGKANCAVDTPRFSNVQQETGLTSIQKLPGVVELGVRPLTVLDLIAPGSTDSLTIRYIQEVTFTNGAGTVGEVDALPTVTLDYAEQDAAVRDMGGFVKMSENLMADFMGVASFINQRLPYMVERTCEDQVLNGDGNAPNIMGILNTAGIQTLALGGNTRLDLAYMLQTKVRWQNLTPGTNAQGGFEPDAYVIHPLDWEKYRLLKDANNQYFGGGPFTGAYGNGEIVKFETLWGKPVAVTPAIDQGTILCGAFRMGAQFFQRQGIVIEMTNSNEDDFKKRIIAVRAAKRGALAVYRPGSFITGTGI